MMTMYQIRFNRCRKPLARQVGVCLLMMVAASLTACGESEGQSGAPRATDEALVIDLDGAAYLWPSKPLALDGDNGGLHALGDINGDGCTDLVVSLSRQGGTERLDRGWIEAYSGKDGTRLWQRGGTSDQKADTGDNAGGYTLQLITLIDDRNGDGIRDIYCRDAGTKRTALLISGRDGARIGRHDVDRTDYLIRPIRWRDLDDDGSADLIFRIYNRQNPLTVQNLSGKDLSVMGTRDDIWPEASGSSPAWVLPRFDDIDGDGQIDCLVRRGLPQSNTDPVYTFEFAVLSGADYSVIKRFETDRPRVGGHTVHASGGDLNGNGAADILIASVTGVGRNNYTSFLRAVSGADGSILWQVLGTDLAGGRKSFTVDVKTKQRTELAADVEFGSAVVSTADVNGDGVRDVATVTGALHDGKSTRAVRVFSGKDGALIATLLPPMDKARLTPDKTQMIYLKSATSTAGPAVAVNARNRQGKAVLVILPLPASR